MSSVSVPTAGTFAALQLAGQVPLLLTQLPEGRIRVAQRGVNRFLWFQQGRIKAVTSSIDDERFGGWLVARNVLPWVEVRDALAAKPRDTRLGRYLVSTHMLDEETIRQELHTLTVTLAGRMLFEAGEYAGDNDQPIAPDASTIDCTPNALFLLATRRVQDTGQFDRLLGGKRLWIAHSSAAGGTAGVDLSPLEAFVLGQLKSPKSLDDLRAAAPDFPKEVGRALACMVAGGLAQDCKAGSHITSSLPAANPKLRALLAEIDPAPLASDEASGPISDDEISQAESDKRRAKLMLQAGGDSRGAHKLLAKAVEVRADADSLVTLAEIELANPLWRQRALDRLKQAVALNPKCTAAWLALANYWGTRGQVDKQRRCLERILEYEPMNDVVRETLSSLSPQ